MWGFSVSSLDMVGIVFYPEHSMKIASHMRIEPSVTLLMNALAAQKKQKGEIVYNLTVGEPQLSTPSVILEAATRAMAQGKTLYTPLAGIPELRTQCANFLNTNFGSSFEKNNIIATCGGKHGLLMSLQVLVEPQDEVLILAPYWVSYPSMVGLVGGVPKIISTSEENGWKVNPQDIVNACTKKTKILILNNGGNPTGVLYSKQEIENILKVAAENNIIVISDEVYSGLVYDKKEFISIASFLQYTSNTLIIQSCSKHFAMTGWRVGFVAGPSEIIEAIETLQSQSTTGTCSISQWAAVGALEYASEIIPVVRDEMQLRRDACIKNFKKYFDVDIVPPEAGLYIFFSLKKIGVPDTDSVAWCMNILSMANVVFVPGAPFGKEGYIRASFGGTIEEVESGLKTLSSFLKKRG